MAADKGPWLIEEPVANYLDSQKSIWHKLREKEMDGG